MYPAGMEHIIPVLVYQRRQPGGITGGDRKINKKNLEDRAQPVSGKPEKHYGLQDHQVGAEIVEVGNYDGAHRVAYRIREGEWFAPREGLDNRDQKIERNDRKQHQEAVAARLPADQQRLQQDCREGRCDKPLFFGI